MRCLEFIVLHELAHVIERRDSARFTAILDRVMPDWQNKSAVLDEAPLTDC